MAEKEAKIDWMEYKTMRQYQSAGDMFDELKTHGVQGVIDMADDSISTDALGRNGHSWLTRDP